MSELLGSEEPLVRLRLITHNARLVDARKSAGLTGEDMASAAEIPRGRLRDLENLRVAPTEAEMIRIAIVLGKPIDDLFPEALLSAIEDGVFSHRKVEISTPQVISLTEAHGRRLLAPLDPQDMEDEIDAKLLKDRVQEALLTLPPQQQHVLTLRYGLCDGCPRTLEQVGREIGVTMERVRQIEGNALRGLRKPRWSRILRHWVLRGGGEISRNEPTKC